MEDRKKDHINLALQSQTARNHLDQRFYYEPVLSGHPSKGLEPVTFLGHKLKAPIWISSMTGGTQMAQKINKNLAQACHDFGLGMGLGSCRIILDSNEHFADFDMRDIIGYELPFYANLGICQVENLLESNKTKLIIDLVDKLRADGLIVHINPMQEWFQPEGDRLKHSPLETIIRLIDKVNFPVIVKEVGQGMGPESLLKLLQLPLAAIEFAAFGGTNFAMVEMLRNPLADHELYDPLTNIGVDAYQMLEIVNDILNSHNKILCHQIIISGGIQSYLDGYYFLKKSKMPALYGQASSFLKHATGDYETLFKFVSGQIKGLEMAFSYLKLK